jgi:hypothetical protein
MGKCYGLRLGLDNSGGLCNAVLMSKARNEAFMRAMQELRRSSAASKHKNKKKYTRKRKYKHVESD